MADKLLNIRQAAKYLNVHPMTLYRWVTKKKIPAAKIGKIWRFKQEKLSEWIDKHTAVK